MKRADVVVGEEYGWAPVRQPTSWARIRVTGPFVEGERKRFASGRYEGQFPVAPVGDERALGMPAMAAPRNLWPWAECEAAMTRWRARFDAERSARAAFVASWGDLPARAGALGLRARLCADGIILDSADPATVRLMIEAIERARAQRTPDDAQAAGELLAEVAR